MKRLVVSLFLPAFVFAAMPYPAWTNTPYPVGSERDMRARRKVLRHIFSSTHVERVPVLQSKPVTELVSRTKPAKTCDLVKNANTRKGSKNGIWKC